MRLALFVHIGAGVLAILVGYGALFSKKGASVHRTSGMLFVYAMVTMGSLGVVLTIVRNKALASNIPAGLLACYLTITALTTVRPRESVPRWLDLAGLVVAFGVGVMSSTFGLVAIASGGALNGIPAVAFFMFGSVGLLAGMGDVRMLRAGGLTGAPRLTRHMWRMWFSLFIAATSFFFGQAKVLPKPIRASGLLGLPVLALFVTLFYWLWRLRVRRTLRGIAIGSVSPKLAVPGPPGV